MNQYGEGGLSWDPSRPTVPPDFGRGSASGPSAMSPSCMKPLSLQDPAWWLEKLSVHGDSTFQ